MKKRREGNYEQLDRDTRLEILIRDEFKCVKCGDTAEDVHEIIPRREIGKKSVHLLFHPMNRVSLCRKCHKSAGAWREELIGLLYEKYNYDYMNNSIFIKYLHDGEDENE